MKEGSGLHHVALNVPDINKKMNLFKNVFGMAVTEIDGPDECPRQVWFDGGIQLISHPEDKGCSIAHIALTSRELKNYVTASEEFGADTLPRGENWLHFPDRLVIELMCEAENRSEVKSGL